MSEDSKGRKIGYWITTGLVAASFMASGAAELAKVEPAIAAIIHLGYPVYFISLLGVAKILAGVTLLVPKFLRLKEWAYAGLVIDLIGASYSHAAFGDGVGEIVTPLVVLAMVMGSYFLRPADRKLPDPAG